MSGSRGKGLLWLDRREECTQIIRKVNVKVLALGYLRVFRCDVDSVWVSDSEDQHIRIIKDKQGDVGT